MAQQIDLSNALMRFSKEEQARLLRYTVRAERLAKCSFFKRGSLSNKVTFSPPDGSATSHIEVAPDEDDEAIDAMYQRLRILYAKGRETSASFPRTMALLKRHLRHEGSDAANLRQRIEEAEQTVAYAMSAGPGIGMSLESMNDDGTVNSRPTPPKEVFEDWLYGEHLHDDEDRLARIDVFRDHGVHRFTALVVAVDLTRAYLGTSRGIVEPVLQEGSVFPSASVGQGG